MLLFYNQLQHLYIHNENMTYVGVRTMYVPFFLWQTTMQTITTITITTITATIPPTIPPIGPVLLLLSLLPSTYVLHNYI